MGGGDYLHLLLELYLEGLVTIRRLVTTRRIQNAGRNPSPSDSEGEECFLRFVIGPRQCRDYLD